VILIRSTGEPPMPHCLGFGCRGRILGKLIICAPMIVTMPAIPMMIVIGPVIIIGRIVGILPMIVIIFVRAVVIVGIVTTLVIARFHVYTEPLLSFRDGRR
jgi:hypothetical protein